MELEGSSSFSSLQIPCYTTNLLSTYQAVLKQKMLLPTVYLQRDPDVTTLRAIFSLHPMLISLFRYNNYHPQKVWTACIYKSMEIGEPWTHNDLDVAIQNNILLSTACVTRWHVQNNYLISLCWLHPNI